LIQYYDNLKIYALKLCNQHLHDAEDLVQDTVLKMLEKYPGLECVKTAATIMRRLFIDRWRRSKVVMFSELMPYHEPAAENDLAKQIDVKNLYQKIDKQKLDCFKSIALQMAGFSMKEIAAIRGKSINTICGHCMDGKLKLIKYYIPRKTKPVA